MDDVGVKHRSDLAECQLPIFVFFVFFKLLEINTFVASSADDIPEAFHEIE